MMGLFFEVWVKSKSGLMQFLIRFSDGQKKRNAVKILNKWTEKKNHKILWKFVRSGLIMQMDHHANK